MVVGLYRSNEVHEAHLVNKWIRDIETLSQDNGIEIKKLELQNLEETHVNQLLSDLLSTDPHITEGLSKIVHKKTLGNVFFVVQFLQTLNDEELLEFNFATYKWLWNEQDVISHTSATTNVVELMRAKMQRLPTATRYILPLAACLGANFTEQMLELLVEHMPNFDVYLTGPSHDKEKSKNHEEEGKQYETSLLLDICEQEGLWEEVAPRNYQWLHDKIQEAVRKVLRLSNMMLIFFVALALTSPPFAIPFFCLTPGIGFGEAREIVSISISCWRYTFHEIRPRNIRRVYLCRGQSSLRATSRFEHSAR